MRSRSAFTLVELLVVIAIIGVLVALLLPAVQAAREAANRMSCGNNLKQLGIACHNYHDTHKKLPLTYNTGDYGLTNSRNTSWMLQAMPFMELGNLYDMMDFRYGPADDPRTGAIASPNNPSNGYVITRPVPAFLCPSDGTTNDGVMGGRANIGWTVGVNNYKGCSGGNWAWGNFQSTGTASHNPGNGNGLDAANGFFGRGPAVSNKFAKCTDGLSNSFLAGEAIPAHCQHSSWYHFNHCTATAGVPLNVKAQCTNTGNKEADRVACTGDWPNNYSFMSRHPGGGQFCMGDGSVRFVPDQVDLNVYRGAGTITSGESTQLP